MASTPSHWGANDEAASGRWNLYADWCIATGRVINDTTEADFTEFARQVRTTPSTMKRRMRTVAERLHWYETRPVLEPAQAWRSPGKYGLDWLAFSEALRHCARAGFPEGFYGRRDAWMLVLVGPTSEGGCGFTRSEAVSIRPDEVHVTASGSVMIRGRLVGVDDNGNRIGVDDPNACPACAVALWLESMNEQAAWGWASVKALHAKANLVVGHACELLAAMPKTWAGGSLTSMCPAYALEGGLRDVARPAMSTRTLSLILSRRCTPKLAVPKDDPAEEAERYSGIHSHLAYEELNEALEDAVSRADVVNRRIAAILNDTDSMLKASGL
jgi:hypothetical protein